MKKEVLIIVLIVGVVLAGSFFLINSFEKKEVKEVLSTESQQIALQTPAPKEEKNMQPLMQIDQNKVYQATLSTTQGDIVIELNAKATPITVNNFVSLIKNGFYDGTIFHRIISGFMIQGGDPEGTGRGGPGYKFDDEPFEGEYLRGTVAMANAGPNTNGSQFFIMHADRPLPKDYVIFGKVISGMDVVDKIADAPTKPGGEGSTPVNPVSITKATVIEK